MHVAYGLARLENYKLSFSRAITKEETLFEEMMQLGSTLMNVHNICSKIKEIFTHPFEYLPIYDEVLFEDLVEPIYLSLVENVVESEALPLTYIIIYDDMETNKIAKIDKKKLCV